MCQLGIKKDNTKQVEDIIQGGGWVPTVAGNEEAIILVRAESRSPGAHRPLQVAAATQRSRHCSKCLHYTAMLWAEPAVNHVEAGRKILSCSFPFRIFHKGMTECKFHPPPPTPHKGGEAEGMQPPDFWLLRCRRETRNESVWRSLSKSHRPARCNPELNRFRQMLKLKLRNFLQKLDLFKML